MGRSVGAAGTPPAVVADLGEFGLIGRILARVPTSPQREVGPGDDAAVLRVPDGRLVATVDVLVEGTHFRRDWSGGYDVGRKAAAANLADVAAMGARTTALLVGLGCPPDLPLAWVDELVEGIAAECAVVGAGVEGGDVVRAPLVFLSITALGDLSGGAPVTRAGAQAGDSVVLVGEPGRSAAGLALLRHASTAAPSGGPSAPPSGGPSDPVAARFPDLVAAHRYPSPPYAAGPDLARSGATAMIDVSDGLLADLGHICDAGGVGVELSAGALAPSRQLRAAADQVGADPWDWVLTGGEDHVLLATVPPGWRATPAVEALGGRVVGNVFDGGGIRIDGRAPVVGRGWDHFGHRGAEVDRPVGPSDG